MEDAFWTIAYFFVFFNACLYTVFNLLLAIALLYGCSLFDSKWRREIYQLEKAKEFEGRKTRFQ